MNSFFTIEDEQFCEAGHKLSQEDVKNLSSRYRNKIMFDLMIRQKEIEKTEGIMKECLTKSLNALKWKYELLIGEENV